MPTEDDLKEVMQIAQESLDREKLCLEALTKIACWKEGPIVTGRFDEPHAAKIARDCLNYLDTMKHGINRGPAN